MNIYIYSDESGVFDYLHNDYFIFAGVMFLSKDQKETMERKYIHAERCMIEAINLKSGQELKASYLKKKEKSKLYRSLNNCIKFAIIINQKKVLKSIFENKKSKQRYLDYAYKIGIKKCFAKLISEKVINPKDVKHLLFFVDDHTTATNGFYELREGLLNEFKYGTFNYEWNIFFQPIFPNLNQLELSFCDSKKKTLVRAADLTANFFFHLSKNKELIISQNSLFVSYLP